MPTADSSHSSDCEPGVLTVAQVAPLDQRPPAASGSHRLADQGDEVAVRRLPRGRGDATSRTPEDRDLAAYGELVLLMAVFAFLGLLILSALP